jgi:hypothetical protein
VSETSGPTEPVTYEIGAVVNGHRFTGTEWIPVSQPGQSRSPSTVWRVLGACLLVLGALLELTNLIMFFSRGDLIGFLFMSVVWCGLIYGGFLLYRRGTVQ